MRQLSNRRIFIKLSFYLAVFSVLGFAFGSFVVTKRAVGQINISTAKTAKKQKPQANLERMFRLTGQLVPQSKLNAFVAGTVTTSKTDALVATPNNGDGKADPGDTIGYTVTINASGMDATSVMFNDTPDMNTMLTGNVLTTPIARNDSYTATGNVRIQISAGSGLLINDNDADGIGPAITATAHTVSSANCAGCNNVVINADGSFSYNPPAGFEGMDTFTYTLNDNEGNTDTATVTVTVSGMIWFINNNATTCTTIAAGCGRLTNPFSSLAAFDAVNGNAGASNPAANEPVFIYESTTAYTAPVTLENGQRFIGQDATGSLSTLAGITLAPNSDALPATNSINATIVTITTGNPAITLGQNNTLRGFTVGDSTTDIGGTNFGTLTVTDVTLNGTGRALNLSTGTLAMNFASISSTDSSTTGISLSSVGGSFVSGSTSITNPTNAGISVASSSATFGFGNTTSNQSGGAGVSLTGNTGTISFADLDIAPDNNQRGLHAINNTGTITTTSGTISTNGVPAASGQPAVEIAGMVSPNQTPLNMTLTSVSANGGTKGIILNNTSSSGSPGGFKVTGTDGGDADTLSDAGTGGTIQNTSVRGVEFNTVSGAITLGGMNFSNASTTNGATASLSCGPVTGDPSLCNAALYFKATTGGVTLNTILADGGEQMGIIGDGITNLNMNNVEVRNFGNDVDESGVLLRNAIGTGSIINSNFHNNQGRQLYFNQGSGTSTFVIKSSTFANANLPNGTQGLLVESNGASTVTNFTVGGTNPGEGCVFQNTFSNGVQALSNNDSDFTFNIYNSTITNTNGTVVQASLGSQINTTWQGNTFIAGANTGSGAFSIKTDGGGSMNGNFIGNTVGQSGVAGSGGNFNGFFINPRFATDTNLLIKGNTVQRIKGAAIVLIPGETTNYNVDVTITGNLFREPEATNRVAIEVRNGVSSGPPADSGCLTTKIGGTVTPGSYPSQLADAKNRIEGDWNGDSGGAEIFLWRRFSTVFNIPNWTGAVNTFVQGQNSFTSATLNVSTLSDGGVPFGNAASCTGSLPAFAEASENEIENQNIQSSSNQPAPEIEGIFWAVDARRSEKSDVPNLTEDQLQAVVQAAIERWRAAGISEEALQKLQRVTFEIAELPDGQLAAGTSRAVKISPNAAGFGWYPDPSPLSDEEFSVPIIGLERQSKEGSPAFRQIDLLTAVTHALGGALGNDKLPSEKPELENQQRWLMQNTLGAGVRRAPAMDWTLVDDNSNIVYPDAPSESTLTVQSGAIPLISNQTEKTQLESNQRLNKGLMLDPQTKGKAIAEAGTQVNLNIGTLPAGKSVTITFNVLINSPSLPLGTTQITNQGTVSGTNFSNVLTDDPAVGGASDPTVTLVDRPDTTVTSIARIGTNPTAANSVSWTVTFPVSIINLASGNFTLVNSGLGGTPVITSIAPVGMAPASQWTVTASTGTGSGTLGLNMTSDAGLSHDVTNLSFTGEVFTVDRTPPDTAINTNPTNPSGSSSAAFTFSGTDTGGSNVASFECQLDGGGFSACTSPQNYSSLADGSHTFQVRAIDGVGNVDASPASFTWVVDTIAPDTSITAQPPAQSGVNVSFSFNGTDGTGTGVASFECQIDGGGFSACTSPKAYNGLADGSHTFQVRAIDNVGNVDASPASYTWNVDGTAPDTTINTNPTNPSNSANASFTFSGTDAGSGVASFECKLDGGSFAACKSPQNYNSLADGSHTFQVRAIDNAGNVDATPASYTWTVDTTAPDTTITANPTNPSGSNVSFSFNGTDGTGTGVASFECQLDGGGFSACTSPQAYNGLSDGSHTFRVRAIDGAGNADGTPASFTWTVDTMPPDTSITANPTDPSGVNVSFSFNGSDAGSGVASFECQLDGAGFAACTSPKSYTNLAQGSHTFQVRAIDNVNNTDPTPASFTWNVDATTPDTTIDSNPANPSNSANASFTFSGTDTGGSMVASFECSLDGGAFAACTSPQNYSSLADGSHTFQVRAIDGVGNLDASPASYTWTVDSTGPDTSITANPTNPSNSGNATFSFSGTDTGGSGVASFECQIDGGSFSACTSPKTYTGLTDGSHTFQVRAIDNAGNADGTPASFTWTVDTAPPDTTINSNPTNPTNSTSAGFTFSGTDTGTGVASFECKLDGGVFAACTSPQNYSGLSNGSHTFEVRAIDGIGNVDASPASFTWTVDTVSPNVSINQAMGQSDPANGLGIQIHFTAVFSEAVTGFTNTDVVIGGTAGATTVVVTEIAPMNGTTYDVAVSGMTMGGTVTVSIPANRAQDAAGNQNTASTSTDNTVTYVPNTPPTANPDSYSTTQDTPLTVAAPSVLGNDSDPDAGNTITAVLVSGPANAQSFTLNANGSFSYNPNTGFTGTDSFTYKAKDNFNAESSTVTVTLSVKYRFDWVSNGGMLGGGFNQQGLNQVTAGSNVALRFTLYGYKGDPYSMAPTSEPINCATNAATGPATTINRFTPDPFYSSLYDFYQTTWQTNTAWKFTCRRLTLHFNDGTTRSLLFYFK